LYGRITCCGSLTKPEDAAAIARTSIYSLWPIIHQDIEGMDGASRAPGNQPQQESATWSEVRRKRTPNTK
jgi:hypothetical protein